VTEFGKGDKREVSGAKPWWIASSVKWLMAGWVPRPTRPPPLAQLITETHRRPQWCSGCYGVTQASTALTGPINS